MIDYNAKDFSDRLNQALDLRGYPPFGRGRVNYIQEIFNISRSGANKWLHGKSIPHPKARKYIAEKLGISLSWLENGTGSPTKVEQELYAAESQASKVPLLSLSEAFDKKTSLNEHHNNLQNMIIVNRTISNSCFAVKLVGRSMLPKFDEGSILIVDPKEQIHDGDYVIARSIMLPEAICRQIIFGSDGKYLIALNPKFQSVKIENEEEIIGKIIEARTAL